jgi:hypothetical protein
MSREIMLKESEIIVTDEKQAVAIWETIQTTKRTLKAMEAYAEERITAFMQDKGIRELTITDTCKLILAPEKKNRYDTEAIYKALEFTPDQIAVLPANPAFRKTAVLSNPKTAPAHYEEVSEVLDANGAEKKRLKEMDLRFLK